MSKFLRALLVAGAATAAAYIFVASTKKEEKRSAVTAPPDEVEPESLPDDVRESLLTELEGHL